jgi:hypothetical protein
MTTSCRLPFLKGVTRPVLAGAGAAITEAGVITAIMVSDPMVPALRGQVANTPKVAAGDWSEKPTSNGSVTAKT